MFVALRGRQRRIKTAQVAPIADYGVAEHAADEVAKSHHVWDFGSVVRVIERESEAALGCRRERRRSHDLRAVAVAWSHA
jgi:hypothetical protein